MKVLSLKEPWGSLIKLGVKKIETRSWSTKYRGELYIHCSLSKIKKKELNPELLSLFQESDLTYGFIICKCKLVDCVLITEEFANHLKRTNKKEYLSGDYTPGRYAWLLSDIKTITPIKARGQLGIWNFDVNKEGNN